MAVQWTRDETICLIKLYKECECLYDDNHRNYFKKEKRMEKLLFLQKQMEELKPGITILQIKHKIRTLSNQVSKERKRRKMVSSKRSAASVSGVYTPTLWCYNDLEFLFNVNDRKERSSNINCANEDPILIEENGTTGPTKQKLIKVLTLEDKIAIVDEYRKIYKTSPATCVQILAEKFGCECFQIRNTLKYNEYAGSYRQIKQKIPSDQLRLTLLNIILNEWIRRCCENGIPVTKGCVREQVVNIASIMDHKWPNDTKKWVEDFKNKEIDPAEYTRLLVKYPSSTKTQQLPVKISDIIRDARTDVTLKKIFDGVKLVDVDFEILHLYESNERRICDLRKVGNLMSALPPSVRITQHFPIPSTSSSSTTHPVSLAPQLHLPITNAGGATLSNPSNQISMGTLIPAKISIPETITKPAATHENDAHIFNGEYIVVDRWTDGHPNKTSSTTNGDDKLKEPRQTPKEITSYQEAINYLKPLEEFALMNENFRAIGLINQLENIFRDVLTELPPDSR